MINVFSEIGELKEVLLHSPSEELENITPDVLKDLLFDDIPYLKIAKEEHDFFANTLTNKGIKVLYLKNLAAEAIANSPETKALFIKQFLQEALIKSAYLVEALTDYLNSFSALALIKKIITGIRKEELKLNKSTLSSYINNDYPFFCNPLPNVLFTRDPFACVGSGVILNAMRNVTRKRESILSEYIFKYHPQYKNTNLYYNRYQPASIEGGDILVLNATTLAVGISERTEAEAINTLAENLFKDSSFRQILAFEIPKKRAFMHLDTVFTQVDYNKFTIHPEAEAKLNVYKITPGQKHLNVCLQNSSLEKILSDLLKLDISLIKCGNGDPIAAPREQWNDGTNTLAIAPGEVIVYNRNYVTNKLLEDNGIKINEIPSSELSRGRGGPRCMSMPLVRKNLETV